MRIEKLYRALGQDEGVSNKLNLSYEKYKYNKVLYAFDIGTELDTGFWCFFINKTWKRSIDNSFQSGIKKNY